MRKQAKQKYIELFFAFNFQCKRFVRLQKNKGRNSIKGLEKNPYKRIGELYTVRKVILHR